MTEDRRGSRQSQSQWIPAEVDLYWFRLIWLL